MTKSFTKGRTGDRVTPIVAAALAAGVLLTGCAGLDPKVPATPTPTGTATATATANIVSDEHLGAALDRMVYQGTPARSSDGGACLVKAARGSGLTREALAYIVKTGSDDKVKVIVGLRNDGREKDSAVLSSPTLRQDFNDCVNADIAKTGGSTSGPISTPTPSQSPTSGTSTPPSTPTTAPTAETSKQANLVPRYPITDTDRITSANQLKPGLIWMFDSFAVDERQKRVYENSGSCLAGVVLEAGFSQETLRFLAGGAPVGTGSVADYLPDENDKTKWQSQEFTTALVDCTLNVTPDDKDGHHA